MTADLNEWGEWKLARVVVPENGHELIAMTFAIIGDKGAEHFYTTMPFDEARQFAHGVLTLTEDE